MLSSRNVKSFKRESVKEVRVQPQIGKQLPFNDKC